ncbi:MAG: hypothetical protein AUJ72_00275 [Candidatus Omnitrophica bacterium CG1_02_46_14]|nr:MAG: hypothetical protein AUJ72_00275 [Candidatus Omnitrophica bacterium CG1_02_46_14]
MKINLFRSETGTIFLATMVSMMIMILIGGFIFQLTSQDTRLVIQMKRSLQAQQLAEAGLARALSTLAASWSGGCTTSNVALGAGTYSTSRTLSGGRYLVSSTGTVEGVSRTTTAEVTEPVTSAFNYALAAGSELEFEIVGQSFIVTGGDIYGGEEVELEAKASSSTITVGKIDSGGEIEVSGSGTITTGTQTENAPQVTFPTVDFSYYQTIAQSTGTYYSGNKTFSTINSIPSPAGRVVFVNGNVTISASQSTTATIIATGSITISGGTTTISPPSSQPAMLTQTGTIAISGTGASNPAGLSVTGLIYSGNNFTISGNHHTVTVNGLIVAQGELEGDYSGSAHNDLTVNYTNPGSLFGISGGSGSGAITSYNS